ncbi:hypothetical protein KC959_02875 [Candidatus Saccharibacteria bacterium]|nr:hypothetical protein [Candidatus Saccharibacteria bacterium]
MVQELQTRVKWRKGLKGYNCILIGNQTIKLQKENGEIVFDLAREQITKVRIQHQYIYLNVGRKIYTVGVIPEVQYRIREKLHKGKLNSSIDEVTSEWKNYFNTSETSTDGTTKPIKVRRVSAVGLAVITAFLLLFNNVISHSRNKKEQFVAPVSNSQSQVNTDDKTTAAPQYIISGYSTNDKYTNRVPDWDGDKTYTSYDDVLAAGKKWQQEKGADSTVEIIELLASGNGQVVAVYDKNGLELIK